MSDTKELNIDELIPDDRNANRGNEEGQQLIERSFKTYGAGRSVLLDKDGRLIAGNKSHDAAKKAGIKKVRVIETTGEELIAVKRTDISLDSKEGREMAIADNATAKANIEFDFVVLDELEEEHGIEMESWGITGEDGGFDVSPEEYGESFDLPEGDRSPFQQMTFTLADKQAEVIKNAMDEIKKTDDFKYCETFGNENGNGNALYLIVATWAGQRI